MVEKKNKNLNKQFTYKNNNLNKQFTHKNNNLNKQFTHKNKNLNKQFTHKNNNLNKQFTHKNNNLNKQFTHKNKPYYKQKLYYIKKKKLEKRKITNYLYMRRKLKKGIFFKKPAFNDIIYPFFLNLKLINEYLKKK